MKKKLRLGFVPGLFSVAAKISFGGRECFFRKIF
jgi:hypothetical protein